MALAPFEGRITIGQYAAGVPNFISKLMTVQDYISKVNELSDDITIFAKRINDQFRVDSEAVLIADLTEDEESLPTKEISILKCPGFDYFLEVTIIKEVLEGFAEEKPRASLKQKAERIIYYAEFDA